MHHDRLFAYGTLDAGGSHSAWLHRLGARVVGPARLDGWTLTQLFKVRGGWPAIVPAARAHVIGTLWRVPPGAWSAIDAWEGAGYRRCELAVRLIGRTPACRSRRRGVVARAAVYVPLSGFVQNGSDRLEKRRMVRRVGARIASPLAGVPQGLRRSPRSPASVGVFDRTTR